MQNCDMRERSDAYPDAYLPLIVLYFVYNAWTKYIDYHPTVVCM